MFRSNRRASLRTPPAPAFGTSASSAPSRSAPRRSCSPPLIARSRRPISARIHVRDCAQLRAGRHAACASPSPARSAYGLWLDRNIKHATLVRTDTLDSAYEQFARDKLEALAGLRPRLLTDVERLPGARIIDGKFTAVQQAVGTSPKNKAAAAYLRGFVEEAKSSGLVAKLIARHNVRGLSVAPKVSHQLR